MPFCTGQGTSDVGGCCHLGNGHVCDHYRSTANVGWVAAEFTEDAVPVVSRQIQGARHVCLIALRVIVADPSTLEDRGLFEQRWTSHPHYLRDVRPHWAALEERAGYERNSYNCATWNGTQGNECCWVQDESTCEAQAAALHATAVTVRRAGGV